MRGTGIRRALALIITSSTVVLTLAGLSGATATADTPVATGSPTATFGIGPASTRGLDGRPALTFLASAGARLQDHVAVRNFATRPVTLRVYAVDAVNTADGAIGYEPRAAKAVDAGAWMSVTLPHHASTITLAARHTVVLPVAVDVPTSAQPGDHAAGIVASLTSEVTSKSGQRVPFEQRVAVRAYFRISGTLRAQLAVQHVQATYSGTLDPVGTGSVTVSYDVTNVGNVRLGATQEVDVSSVLSSAAASPRPAAIPLLLPGGTAHVSVTVPGVLPVLHVTAHVRLTPVLIAGDVDPELSSRYGATAGAWAVPWSLIALLALVILAVAGWRWRGRRSVPATTTEPGSGDLVAAGRARR